MTSAGERKWASARRGGMTVLGKVSVPKPINLPSQRLENHGLDPNVEIVPKGTLSWGSRSSAGSNAWGLSASSPSTDGSSSFSSHLVGRPSSGGGTRPSTAGSEKAHDSNFNAWSSNSRPSSASGVLASNNASLTSLRPRSAETRPGSSQLSRFAEPLAESSGAWASCATSEQIGVSTSGKDGFSLSSGDFPTLGSEKDESAKMEPLDHASHKCPVSSPGMTAMTESMEIAHGDFKGNSWRKDGPYVEDGPRPNMERCYGEPQPYQNPNMVPPHYDSWRGSLPVNPPAGVWYRGPPVPPPYCAPGAHGVFPMEPFPYYPPQVPAPGLANSQPVPPPGAGPQGHYSKNGDMCRPHMSESYMRPSMPIRPGFYPAPLPYEGYYGRPIGFCNPNERDLPFMGMPTGPPVYNRPFNPNVPDPNHSHPRPGEGRTPDQVEPGHPHDPRGNSGVLRKQNDAWNQNDEQKWGHKGATGASNHDKGILSKSYVQENDWGDDYKKNEDMQYGKIAPVEEGPSQSIENKFGASNSANLKFPGSVNSVEDADMSPAIENVASPKDHSLIQKIEGLNAKARASVGRQDDLHMVEQHDGMQIINAKANQSATDANSNIVLERHYPTGLLVPVSCDIHFGSVDTSCGITVPSVTAASRKSTRGAQSRVHHHGKGSFNELDADGWGKRFESPTVALAEGSGSNINKVSDHHVVVHPAEMPKPNVEKGDSESFMPTYDPSDAQRAKMKEIAKQRAIQLQKEEEERMREQKVKALAKLEELNRRSGDLAKENPGHKLGNVPPHHPASHKLEGNSSAASSNNTAQMNESGVRSTVVSTVVSMHMDAETKKAAYRDSALSQNQLPTADVNFDDAAGYRTAPQVSEVSKQKHVGHKQKQSILPEKNVTRDSVTAARIDVVKDPPKDSVGFGEIAYGEVVSETGRNLDESLHILPSLVHQKKKNKSGRNKHKVEELSTEVSLSGDVAKDSNHAEAIPETKEQNASSLSINSTSNQSSAARDVTHSSENHSLSHEDVHGRQNNLWKHQHSRKPRNSLGNRSSDKSHNNDAVIWAPVRSINKVEATDQTSKKAAEPSAPGATGDNLVNNSVKTRRAEMERYVPKPVAKELAQQGSIHRSPSLSVDQAANDGTEGRLKASQGSDYVAKAAALAESKHVDGKNRQRAQGSWRQRVSAESIPVQASLDSSSSAAKTGKDFETPNVSGQNVKSDESLVREPSCRSDLEPTTKGPQINDSVSSLSSSFAGRKDHGPSGRGRKQLFKGHKGHGGNPNINHEDINAGVTDLQLPHVERSQTERTVPSKENRAVGDRSISHWQPKAQSYMAHNQQGNRSHSSQNPVTEDTGKGFERETGHSGGTHYSSQYNRGATGDPIVSKDKDAGTGIPSLGHQENKQEKLIVPAQGRPYSPNQGSVGEVEPGLYGAAEGHYEQRPSSGYRKNANYSSRCGKGHESRGNWSSTGQETKHHYPSANRERQRPNAHYEYQRVGSYNNNSSRSNDSGAQTENQSGGSKFHERAQSHARHGRGNFHGRPRGNPTEAGNE